MRAKRWLGATIAGMAALLTGCSGGAARPASGPAPDEVSVGYGTQARGTVTGSVQSVRPSHAEASRYARIEELLEGRVAGLQVTRLGNGRISLRIRGTTSLMGSTEPLLVVDGTIVPQFATQSALMGIAPGDVERIDVLKDAGSTAIYGSRGANGVIEITTRRGG